MWQLFSKKIPKVRAEVSVAAVKMEFWTMEGYAVGFKIGVSVVKVRIILGGD